MNQGISRVVWSFWTKPFQTYYKSFWLSEKHHLLAWILSVETARQHYPETVLVTDDAGVKMLVEGLGLKFSTVSAELNALGDCNPEWWAIGKLYAYRSQTQPFIHIDTDVFLWNALPERMNSAPVLAQNPEYFPFGNCPWYRPEILDAQVKNAGGWLPPEWEWSIARQSNQGINCGVFGGNRVDFIRHYADEAIRLLEHPRNQQVISQLNNRLQQNLSLEQYFLSACLAYHRNRETSIYRDIEIQYLFDSWEDAFNPAKAEAVGYTHLIGTAKQDKKVAQRLEKRISQDYPDYYKRCLDYANSQ